MRFLMVLLLTGTSIRSCQYECAPSALTACSDGCIRNGGHMQSFAGDGPVCTCEYTVKP